MTAWEAGMPLFKLDHRPCLILCQFSSPRLPVVTVIVTRHSSPVSRLVDISYDSLLTLGGMDIADEGHGAYCDDTPFASFSATGIACRYRLRCSLLFERFCKYVGAVSESGPSTSAPPREAKKQKHKHVLIKE
jgi:hypothetical protein